MMNIVARAYGAPAYTISASAINTAATTTTRRRLIDVHLTPPLDSVRGAPSDIEGRVILDPFA